MYAHKLADMLEGHILLPRSVERVRRAVREYARQAGQPKTQDNVP